MRLLVLGGTKFLGRYVVESALARGHQVTLFNRGLSNPELFPETEKLRGNRDSDLRLLEGRKWDAVVDTCGFTSAQVRATANQLANAVEHYTFISSISVYSDFSKAGLDESSALAQLPKGKEEEQGDPETYGARKVLCEQAATEAMPSRVLCVRPGIIVGPHDTTGRFLYWARRLANQGEVLAPGNPETPVQLIDVRDLAQWIITMIEARRVGVYNATGPSSTFTFKAMLEQCGQGCGGRARLTWVDEQFLLKSGFKPFTDLPFWLPTGSHSGFFLVDCRRAISSGLVFRPLVETAKDVLSWFRTNNGAEEIGLELLREKEVLRSWRNQQAR